MTSVPATTPIAEPGAAVGYAPRSSWRTRFLSGSAGPVLVVCLAILALWYLGAVLLNAPFAREKLERAGQPFTTAELINATLNDQRPVLPSPHQVAAEIYKTTFTVKPSSKRSLVYHGWVTLSSTLLGFLMGTVLGIALAVGIVHSRTLDRSLMPWVIASQTIPILAIAPMVVVVLNAVGLTGLVPKAIISTYLSFFPVAVGVVKGLRSPEPIHLDLMRTYNASRAQVFWKLRWPASVPFLFTSMKVGVAASLVGAIVGELPTGAVAGLGARLLTGSYYGQTVQIWAALIAASVMAGVLVGIVGAVNRIVLKRMGMAA
jgi:NitT/TauT family transport system permease protein